MSKSKKIAIGGVVLFLVFAVWLWQKIKAAQSLGFSVGSPQNIKINWTGGFLTWIQNITVVNGENTSLTINTVNLNLIANTHPIGKATLMKAQTIAANSQTTIQVAVTCGLLDLGTAIPEAVTSFGTNKKETFTMDGTVSALGASVALNQKFEFDFSKIL